MYLKAIKNRSASDVFLLYLIKIVEKQMKLLETNLFVFLRVEWLRHIGSPGSKIERVEFENWNTITRYDYKDYQIRF